MDLHFKGPTVLDSTRLFNFKNIKKKLINLRAIFMVPLNERVRRKSGLVELEHILSMVVISVLNLSVMEIATSPYAWISEI